MTAPASWGSRAPSGTPIPVSGLMVDQQAALLAHDCRTVPGATKCTFGTGAFLLTNTGSHSPHTGAKIGLVLFSGLALSTARPTYCVDGQVYTVSVGGALADRLGCDRQCRGARPGPPAPSTTRGPVTFIPALRGTRRTLVARRRPSASVTGLSDSTRSWRHRRRALLLTASAAQVAAMVDAARSRSRLARRILQVDGGLTQSRVLMQTSRPTSCSNSCRGLRFERRHRSRRRPRRAHGYRRHLGGGSDEVAALDGLRASNERRRGWRDPRTTPPRGDAHARVARVMSEKSGTPRGGVDSVEMVDVVIVGAGVVGAAMARELSHYDLNIQLIDAANDVGARTSKANTAILHTGFDALPGTLESQLVRRGYQLLDDYAGETGIAVERVGALLVAWDDEQFAALDGLTAKALKNGYEECSRICSDELYALEPHLGPGALGALMVPGESIICPWSTTLAFATQAVRAGVTLRLETRVEHVDVENDVVRVRTDRGDVTARVLINAAGLNSDVIDHEFGHDGFHVTPRRGQLLVYDKLARSLVEHILLPVPSSLGKGVLVAPTVYGNVLLGPTAEDLDDKGATESTQEGIAFLLEKGSRIMPTLLDEEVSAVYAGLRAASEHGDYQIDVHPDQHYVCVGAIRSTGLTASMAIAEHVTGLVAQCGLELGERHDLEPITVPMLGQAFQRPYQRAELVRADPLYGDIVCHCERVTRGEVRDAFASDLAPLGLDGLRRRTRVMNGRCQGFYCGAAVEALADEARRNQS